MADDEPSGNSPRDDYVNFPNTVPFSRKLVQTFIQEYKNHPCLWNKKDSGFKHKPRRHEAISALTKVVQRHDPSATRVHILRKIESLRACVRRERKKVLDSRRNASNYEPSLWYYDLFSFIWEKEDSTESNVKQGKRSQNKMLVEEPEEEEDDTTYEDSQIYEPNLSEARIQVSEPRQYPEYDDSKEKRLCTEVEDEYDAIGINVAAKLRNLPHNMRILAEKLINDVLFQAQTNSLNSSTAISTQDPFKSEPV